MLKVKETHYSQCLKRNMNILIYGNCGIPFLVFPCQDAMCDNFENFGMIETLSDYLENGQIRLFCVDTVDQESWSDIHGDKEYRAYIQEQYYHYIVEEILPFLQEKYQIKMRIMTMGFSLGATHAAILFFRRPDLFDGVIGLSGCYDAPHFWDNWCNEILYNNSPVHFLANMPKNHPYIHLYNQRQIILSVGQGQWQREGIRTICILQEIFNQKGIHGWLDLWGYDVDHDWLWWKIQVRYFLDFLLK